MRLNFNDIIDKHLNEPVVVAGHGPSLDESKGEIERLQGNQKILRISVNNWYEFFSIKPDYWILANTHHTVSRDEIKMNKYQVPVFFASSVDLSNIEYLEKSASFDFLPYDQRHFRGHSCREIWENFHKHYEREETYDFKYYGSNSTQWVSKQMWAYQNNPPFPPRISYGCCPNRSLTVQEKLQEETGYHQHYSSGDTVLLHAIAFAIIMGCNPIYITGLDLNYCAGYASSTNSPEQLQKEQIALRASGQKWKSYNHRLNIINDLRILNESALKKNIEIINLLKDPWYKQFKQGGLVEP